VQRYSLEFKLKAVKHRIVLPLVQGRRDPWVLVSHHRRAAARLTEHEFKAYGGSVDAASLVFMHSGLDGAIHDLCRVTALVDPQQWQSFIDNQQERLAVIRTKGYEAVARERLNAFVDTLSRESLIKKTDRLFQVCPPDRAYSRKGYRFDRERLVTLDGLRHDIVHGDRPRAPIDDVAAAIDFMHETGLFFFGMVNHRYGLKLDPRYFAIP
jgi:hypothetical protein